MNLSINIIKLAIIQIIIFCNLLIIAKIDIKYEYILFNVNY